jgi:nicotinamide mononucleotide transporter
VIAAVLIVTAVVGSLISGTGAARPYVDSFTTVASVVTTFMVARKVLENWLYWIVIDAVSIWLYLDRGLQSTAGLFALYVVLAVVGYFQWRGRQVPAGAV